jgi:hypothetical protein
VIHPGSVRRAAPPSPLCRSTKASIDPASTGQVSIASADPPTSIDTQIDSPIQKR